MSDFDFDVVVVGSLNLDLVVRAPRRPDGGETISGSEYAEYAGGKGLNQAVAAARSGASVALVGNVGADSAGDDLRSIVRGEGIDDRWLGTLDDAPTGRALITVDDRGENSIIVVAGANAGSVASDLPTGRVVLAQLETTVAGVVGAFARARHDGSTTMLNPAPAVALTDALLDLCDVLVPNEHEVDLLGGRDRVASRVEHLVITLGSRGADHVHADTTLHIDPFDVVPVDTTGAGDAFCGALASRIAAGDDMATALRYASAAGALATTRAGAVPSQPRFDEVRRLSGG
ncbi:MAG: ribokinase [Ilumatobacter sp.]|uniref:ribokinase n=1 Tax=Ilumatobacter sp. TaxID=1967498 RepID=UPI003297D3D7